jgi:hypothetical protein
MLLKKQEIFIATLKQTEKPAKEEGQEVVFFSTFF